MTKISVDELEILKGKLSEAVKKPQTYGQLAPLQAELDAADASRYHDDGSLPDDDNLALIDECYELLAKAVDVATDVDDRVKPIISNLRGISKALGRLRSSKSQCSTQEVQHWQQCLDAIDSKRTDGVFGGDLKDVPAGQAMAAELLEQGYEMARALLETATEMDSHLREQVYDPLVKHKRHLEGIAKEFKAEPGAHAELELGKVQGMLDAIDSARLASTPVGFGVRDGKVPAGQAVCHSLLEDCYRLVRKIQNMEEEKKGAKTS